MFEIGDRIDIWGYGIGVILGIVLRTPISTNPNIPFYKILLNDRIMHLPVEFTDSRFNHV